MQATFSRRLAMGHAGDWRRDGRRDAASTTTRAAVHDQHPWKRIEKEIIAAETSV
jgi:hypothetical protein